VALYESIGFMYTDSNPPGPGPSPPAGGGGGDGGPDSGGGSGDGPTGPDGPGDGPDDGGGDGPDGPGDSPDGPDKNEADSSGDPVDSKTGLFMFERSDIYVRGLIPIQIKRVYRPGDTISRAFGIGTTHAYAMYLREVTGTPGGRYQQYDLIRVDGSVLRFFRTSPGGGYTDVVAEHTGSSTSYYKARFAYENGNYVITKKDGTKFAFSLYGTLQFIQDRLGNRIEVTRNGGQITRLTTSSGRYVDLTYDVSNHITQIKDISGRAWGYSYSAAGYLTQATFPDGLFEAYSYDSGGRLLAFTDRKGMVLITNTYDASGRVSTQTMANGGIYNFVYTVDVSGNVTQTDTTDPRGNIRRTTFGPLGYKASVTLAYGTPLAQTTTYERDSGSGLRTADIDPLGRRSEYQRDAYGNVTQRRKLVGTVNAYTVNFTYTTDFNKIASYTDPRGKMTTYTYNPLGLVTKIVDPLGHSNTYTYDAQGKLLTLKDGVNNTTTFTYDLSDLRSIKDALNRITTIFTDALGRRVAVTDALGRTKSTEYDLMGSVVKTIDPLGQVSTMTYDNNGNRLTYTNAKNQIVTWGYDTSNRNTTRKDALGQTETTVYDINGNVISHTDRRGLTRTFTYDSLDRRTQLTFSGGSLTTFTYDAGNRNTQIADSVSGTITRAYDSRDRLVGETTPQGSVSYTYDVASRRTSITVTGQPAVTYAYDDANRLTSISQNGKTTTSVYDNANRMTQSVMGNGVAKSYVYDVANQLSTITFKKGTTTIGDLIYAYDNGGQVVTQNGSLARTSLPPATTGNAVYDANNRLTNWNGQAITYDAQGNMLSSGSKTYTWDVRNRLTSVAGGTTASFSYDAMGRRISKTVPLTANTPTQFTYDGANPIVEKQGATVTGTNLTGMGMDAYLIRKDGATETYPLTDHLGSIVALTDAAGAIVTSYTYEPYGATTQTGTTSTNPHQYTGRENDGTGLYFYRARYYDPLLMRFISEDPIGLGGGVNAYGYVDGNPISYTDPSGLLCVYSQSARTFRCTNPDGTVYNSGTGYSGNGRGLNNPAEQGTSNVGPIPQGDYLVGAARDSARTGRAVRDLTPAPGTDTRGRGDFQLHGDNDRGDNSASHGCVILPRNVRDAVRPGETLRVVP
jgi:RHS repeat-associated protein